MTEFEFQQLVEEVDVEKVSFDGFDLTLTFKNGRIVTVSKSYFLDCAVWEFDSDEDKRKRQLEFEKRQAELERKNKEKERLQNEILSKYPKHLHPNIKEAFK